MERCCPCHADVVISSPCGMFDGTCWRCESGEDDAAPEPMVLFTLIEMPAADGGIPF